WARAIRKDVAQMSVTPPASDSRTHHAKGGIAGLFHVFRGQGLREARPACARLKLCIGVEERRTTADAAIETVVVVVPVVSGECCLGAVGAGNVKSAGRELFPPLAFGFHDLGHMDKALALAGVRELHDVHVRRLRIGKRLCSIHKSPGKRLFSIVVVAQTTMLWIPSVQALSQVSPQSMAAGPANPRSS